MRALTTPFLHATLFLVSALAAPQNSSPNRVVLEGDMAVVTNTQVVLETKPAAVVYVNQDGETLSTVAASAASTLSAPSAESSASTASSTSISSLGYGIAYSPYTNDGACKTQNDIDIDVRQFSGYGWIRTYGTDCSQTATVLSAAVAGGMKLFAGIYDLDDVASEVGLIIQAAQSDWSNLAAVAVGNEGVNDGVYSVDAAVAAVNLARTALRSAGFTGPVVTVDTFDAIIANPALCEASDFAAANCHAFFASDVTAGQAGAYVLQQAQAVQAACPGRDTIITESGWPSAGEANGAAVPSPDNQLAALASLRAAFADRLVLFSAFNNYWMANSAGTFDSEWYWGIYGDSSTAGPSPS